MKKSFLIFLLLSVLIFSASCGKIVDPDAAKGSVIETTSNGSGDTTETETEPNEEPHPQRAPQPGSDYNDNSSGGDSGGGISSFSSGGSGYSGSGSSSSSLNSLPEAHGAMLISNMPSSFPDTRKINIFEGVRAESDGSLTDAAKDKINNVNLSRNLEKIGNILKTDRQFSEFFFTVVSQEDKPDGDKVKIKLNDSYRNKTAFVFFTDSKGNIQRTDKNSERNYISYKLDDQHFKDNILSLNFGTNPGTFITVFGK